MDEMHVTAVHEAGHALVARLFGFPVHDTFVHRGGGWGYVRWGTNGDQRTTQGRLVTAAGAGAEMFVFGEIVSSVEQLWGDIKMGGWGDWNEFEAAARNVSSMITADRLMDTILSLNAV